MEYNQEKTTQSNNTNCNSSDKIYSRNDQNDLVYALRTDKQDTTKKDELPKQSILEKTIEQTKDSSTKEQTKKRELTLEDQAWSLIYFS